MRPHRRAQREAERDTARTSTLAASGPLDAEFVAGSITVEHVDALTAASKPLEPDQRNRLMSDASLGMVTRNTTPEQFRDALKLRVRGLLADDGIERLALSSLRARLCEGLVTTVARDEHGAALNVGRSRRLATPAQRRALRAMYPTCAVPGCRVRFDHTSPHHIVWWRHLGRTDLDNLLPLCSRHHHLVHDAGWHLDLDPATRHLTITLPHGVVIDGPMSGRSPPTTRAG